MTYFSFLIPLTLCNYVTPGSNREVMETGRLRRWWASCGNNGHLLAETQAVKRLDRRRGVSARSVTAAVALYPVTPPCSQNPRQTLF